MKVGAVIAAVVVGAAAIGATYWIARPSTSAVTAAGAEESVESAEPSPSKTGPHPKIVLPEDTYNFGIMKFGETQKHAFVVRNEGEAPLKLGTPQTTCQCTVSEAAKDAIPPGGEGLVTLEWTPTGPTEVFDKGAMLRTNDPKMPELRLKVSGRVDPEAVVEPQGSWYAGEVSGDGPIRVTGFVFSRLRDDLNVESVEPASPHVTATAEPMSDEELKEREAKSGYRVVAVASQEIPIGRFEEQLTIRTNAEDEDLREIKTQLRGTRHGPIQILPTPGVQWNPESFGIDLGRFPAREGAAAKLLLFVSGLPEGEELRLEKVDSTVPSVEVDLKRDTESPAGNRQKYELTLRVKPGAPPGTHRGRGAAHVTVATNHPGAEEMKFKLAFLSSP